MVAEARLAENVTGFPSSDRERLVALLEVLGLPSSLPANVDADAVVRAAAFDKKNVAGTLRCALPAAIGRMPDGPSVVVAVDAAALYGALGGS
jgi:3-dehydroquinate synthase